MAKKKGLPLRLCRVLPLALSSVAQNNTIARLPTAM
jgi:hypothetical protein